MRLPIPKNKLVAFTLAGALLTAVIGGGVALPSPGVSGGDTRDDAGTPSTGAPPAAARVPTPDPGYAPRAARAAGVGEFAPDVDRRAGAGAAGTDGY